MSKRPSTAATSRTDWARVMADEKTGLPPTLSDDDTELTAGEVAGVVVRRRGQRGPQKAATKQGVYIRLDAVVIEAFKGPGADGWQTRINDALLSLVMANGAAPTRARKKSSHVATKSVSKTAGRGSRMAKARKR